MHGHLCELTPQDPTALRTVLRMENLIMVTHIVFPVATISGRPQPKHIRNDIRAYDCIQVLFPLVLCYIVLHLPYLFFGVDNKRIILAIALLSCPALV